MPAIVRTVVALGLAATLPAADLDEQGWRAGVELLPWIWETSVASPNGTFDDEEDVLTAGLNVGWRKSFARPGALSGPGLGLAVAMIRADFDAGPLDVYEARVDGAWGWALTHRNSVWVGLRAGWGLASLDLTDAGAFGDYSADGDGWSLTPYAEWLWAVGETWAVGASVGLRAATYELSGGPLAIDLEQYGPVLGVVIEWRPGSAPRRIE